MNHSLENMVLPPPTEEDVDTRLEQINQLKYFLATAPTHWDAHPEDPPLHRYSLPSGESVSCVRWHQGFYISGTDIVRSLVFRFHAFGRPVQNLKKFEEGIFSDLRNLKPGTDATLEEPKSSFLDLLYKHNCIRTQKKQKVFNWFSVPHDRLFLDALERDLKREKLGTEATSAAVAHPAVAITLDTTQAMFDEFRKNLLSDLDLHACLSGEHRARKSSSTATSLSSSSSSSSASYPSAPQSKINHSVNSSSASSASASALSASASVSSALLPSSSSSPVINSASTVFGHFSLFEGSPTYKQRRRRTAQSPRPDHHHLHHHQSSRSSWWPYENTRGTFTSAKSPKTSSLSSSSSSSGAADYMEDPARLYTCPLSSCGKIFKRLEHLKRHLRTHTMERPYLCGLCGKRFSRSDNLAQHKKTHQRRQRIMADNRSDSSDHSNNHSPLLRNRNASTNQQQQEQQSRHSYSTANNSVNNDDETTQQQGYHCSNVSIESPSLSSSSSPTMYEQQQQQPMVWVTSNSIPPITVTYKGHHQDDDLHEFFPSLSASTSSSSISSCQSSPTVIPSTTQLMIKTEPFHYDHQQHHQLTPTTPTSAMEELLSASSPQHHQHHHRDWNFSLDWDHSSTTSLSCLSSPQTSSLFMDPSSVPSPTLSYTPHQQHSSYDNTSNMDHYHHHPSSISSYSDDESPLLKPIDTSAYYYTSAFQDTTMRPLDSLMHF